MRFIVGCGLAVVMAVAAGAAAPEKKDEKKFDSGKLLGKWEPKDLPAGIKVTVEFAKDGKLLLIYDERGKAQKSEGTYKLDGDKLSVVLKKGDKDEKETMTVKKLTDTELVTTDEKGKEETLMKLKEK